MLIPPFLGALAWVLISLATASAAPFADTTESTPQGARMIVVAIADRPDSVVGAGATPRGYSGLADYSGSARSRAAAKRIANDYSLHEVSAWTIDALHVRCMLYELPVGVDRNAALARLRADRRVDLAQALQEFATYAVPSPAIPLAVPENRVGYNDP
jgi:hypothetical protein